MPKFSIITASWNYGAFIETALRSVAGQGVADYEHIVVDNCSTDATTEIVARFPNVRLIREPDRGQTDAINKGFRAATGDWLMWLNADDYLLPGALAQVGAFIAAHPEADVVYGDAVFESDGGTTVRHRREHHFDFGTLLYYGCYIPSTACFLRRSIRDSGLLLDDTFKVCMDFDYYVRIAEAGHRFGYMGKPLARFRWHAGNVSTNFAAQRYEERLRVQRAWLGRHGRAWQGGEQTLLALCWLYRFKRQWLRLRARMG